MSYSISLPFEGETDRALDAAILLLGQNGFVVVDRDETRLEMDGPGLQSTKQNPLLGASHVWIDRDEGALRLEAELGGVDAMRRLLVYLPLGLAVFFVLLFGVIGGVVWGAGIGAVGWQWLLRITPVAVLPLAPWLVISPLMMRWIRGRTECALDGLLANVAALGTQRERVAT